MILSVQLALVLMAVGLFLTVSVIANSDDPGIANAAPLPFVMSMAVVALWELVP